jgi:hypothetical protein
LQHRVGTNRKRAVIDGKEVAQKESKKVNKREALMIDDDGDGDGDDVCCSDVALKSDRSLLI